MPGERVGWGRLKGEGEEWQLGACPSYGWWAGTSLGQLQLIQHVFEFQLVRHLSLGIGRNDMGEAALPSWGSGWWYCALLTPSVTV